MRIIRKQFGDPERDEFAARLGVSKNTLASYERGETEPTASVLATYSSTLGININWLVTGKGEMFASSHQDSSGIVAQLASEIQKLPPDRQQLVLGMMRSIVNHELHK